MPSRAADAQQFDLPRQLPALRNGNCGADASVRARAEADHEALDLLALHFRRTQRLIDHCKRFVRPGRRFFGSRFLERQPRFVAAKKNSSAKIFIRGRNSPLGFRKDFNFHSPYIRHSKFVIRHSLGPFNHRHTIRLQIILDPRRQNLLLRFEAIQIEMKQSQPSAGIND